MKYSAYLLTKSSKYRLLPVLEDEHDMVKTIPSDVALFFSFAHRLSPHRTTRYPEGLSLVSRYFNSVSVEPLTVTPPEAVV